MKNTLIQLTVSAGLGASVDSLEEQVPLPRPRDCCTDKDI